MNPPFTLNTLLDVALGHNSLVPQEAAAAVVRPNIVFILADDLGSGDLKC